MTGNRPTLKRKRKPALPVTVAPPLYLLPDGTADLDAVLRHAVMPALVLMPEYISVGIEAQVMLLAIGLQESQFLAREQGGGGPARGFWQFEQGTEASRGGVYGIYLHEASCDVLLDCCDARKVAFDPEAIYKAIELDDVLAACCARLLLYTDPYALPDVGYEGSAWDLYLRTWRPGKPHPDVWPDNYARALAVIEREATA
jgi:hypothetical protein